MKNIAVIGAGTMGNGIAHIFAQFDYNVQLIDVSQKALDKGIATITKNLGRMVAKEKISEEDKESLKLETLTSIYKFWFDFLTKYLVNSPLLISSWVKIG